MPRYLIPFLCLLFCGAAAAAESSEKLQLLIEQKLYEQAIRSGETILLQRPDDTRARFLTAYAYQMSSHTDKAITLYQQLIRDEPSLPEPRNNLAMIYLAAGDYDNASRLLVEAINTHSSYATAYDNLSRVYKGIASEAYRRALSESSEPAKYTHDIQLNAITSLDSLNIVDGPATQLAAITAAQPSAAETAAPEPVPTTAPAAAASEQQPPLTPAQPVQQVATVSQDTPAASATTSYETRLIETVRNWASAWSGKAFDNYTAAYAPGYRAGFNTHAQWLEHRRSRIVRPGELRVEVSDFKVRLRGDERASVDFVQAYSSPGYSDRVVKRLDLSRSGAQWKITHERVLSVL